MHVILGIVLAATLAPQAVTDDVDVLSAIIEGGSVYDGLGG